MEKQITDFLYYVTIGKPHHSQNLDQKTKLKKALNKALCVILNVPDRNQANTTNNILSLRHNNEPVSPTPPSKTAAPSLNDDINDHIQYISKIYEKISQKFFLNSQYHFDLTQDDFEIRQKLHQKGSLDSVSLIFPKTKTKKGTTSIICLNGDGYGASVNIGDDSVCVLKSGDKYTLSDILIGFIDNDVHIFKPESLKNIKLTNNILQNSLNTHINTNLYRLLNPSLDVQKIKAIQKLIQTNGLDFVINLFVKEHIHTN